MICQKSIRSCYLISLFCFLVSHSGYSQLTNLWSTRLQEFYSDAAPAIASDGTIYQPGFDGSLIAFTPDGDVLWRFNTGIEIESSPAIASDGTIYFGSRDRKFYAVTPEGKLKWTFETGAWNDSSPAIASEGTIYFGSWDKTFYALNPDGSAKWKFPTGGIIDSSPAIGADGTVYFGSHDKKFYALTPDGKLKWSFTTGGQIYSSPAINYDGDIFFTSTDGKLYALKSDGSELWHLLTTSPTPSSPVIDRYGTIYLGENQFCLAVTPDGKKKWEQDMGDWIMGSPIVTDSQIYALSRSRWIKSFTLDGSLAWTAISHDPGTASPTLGTNGIMYYSCRGYFCALAPTNAQPLANGPWPVFRANPGHTGRVNTQ